MSVVLDILERYQIDPVLTKINILESSTTPFLGGTSAELLAGDKISVQELFYGMMLPSGNDAAQSLAIYFGNLMLLLKEKHGQVAESIVSDQIVNSAKTIDANIYDDQYPDVEEPDTSDKLDKTDQKEEKIDLEDN